MSMPVENSNRRKRPKRKGSRFMRNAKGFAKQGIFGRGTHIDDEQFSYFVNILDTMKDLEDVEQRVNMANSVFELATDQEVHLASNQIVCKVLESLVGFVEDLQLERFFGKFADNFRPICSDRFASHVLQKMVEIAFLRALSASALKSNDEENILAPIGVKRSRADTAHNEEQYNLETKFTDEHRESCRQFVLRVSKFLLNNLEDFVWDACANHIMRTCILCLAGVHVPKVAFQKGGAEMAKYRKLFHVSDDWTEVMKEFPRRLEMWPQFSEFPYQEHSSALLSVICLALRAVDKNLLKHFGKKILVEGMLKVNDDDIKNEKKIETSYDIQESQSIIIEEDTKNISLPKVFEHQSSIILLETLLSVAGAKLLTQLYAMLFTGRVEHLAKQPLTNFSVQKLLQHIKEKEDFESIFNELHMHTEELLQIGHTGVVSSLATACLRLSTSKQAQMIGALQNALHVAGDKEKSTQFFACLVKLKPYEITLKDTTGYVHLHGSLIIQQILQYNKPIFLVNCILETSAEQLTTIFNTPNGSHIVDAFMKSKFIGEKSREKLIRNLEGFYVDLAITRHGSRIVEQCFDAAQDSQKSRIVKELADKANMLKGSMFGRLVYNKLHVDTFKISASQWKARLGQKKVTEIFKDIIN